MTASRDANASIASLESRIVGGTIAVPFSIPWLVSLTYLGTHYCAASYAGGRWLLTAAHCCDAVPSSFVANFYVHDLSLVSSEHECSESIAAEYALKHPYYNPQRINYDACLVFLAAAPRCAIVPPALDSSSPTGTVVAPSALTIAGWGDTVAHQPNDDSVPPVYSAVLKVADVRLVVPCYSWISNSMMCASSAHNDSCQGDSGGPLYADGTIYGIVSFGFGCAQPAYPSVYSRVSASFAWLNATMADALPPPAPPGTFVCTDSCYFARDLVCDDGGPGSEFAVCEYGSDCTDCVRTEAPTNACDCSSTPYSGSAYTGIVGCADHLNDGALYCYVVAPSYCANAIPSGLYAGAAYIWCAPPSLPPPLAPPTRPPHPPTLPSQGPSPLAPPPEQSQTYSYTPAPPATVATVVVGTSNASLLDAAPQTFPPPPSLSPTPSTRIRSIGPVIALFVLIPFVVALSVFVCWITIRRS